MKYAHNIAILLVIIIMTGCSTRESYMESWVGTHVDDLTVSWGSPDSRMSRQDGGATYTWTSFSSNEYGVHECRETFVTDKLGVVVSWSYNGCSAFVRTW